MLKGGLNMYEHKDGYCDRCHRKKEDCICNVAIKNDCEDIKYYTPSYKNNYDCSARRDDYQPLPPKDDCPPSPPKNDCSPQKKDDCQPPKKDDCSNKSPQKKDHYKRNQYSAYQARCPYYRCPFLDQDLCDLECFIPLIAIVAMLLCSGAYDQRNIHLIPLFALLYLVIL